MMIDDFVYFVAPGFCKGRYFWLFPGLSAVRGAQSEGRSEGYRRHERPDVHCRDGTHAGPLDHPWQKKRPIFADRIPSGYVIQKAIEKWP